MEEGELKKTILLRLKSLNTFIREMENFASLYGINIEGESLYVAACSQRKLLRDLLDLNK
jgi:hypothetical protein